MSEREDVYALTRLGAEALAEQPENLRAQLRAAFGDDAGDAQFLLMRFVEGRERRELPVPNEEECDRVKMWLAQHTADTYLLSLVMKGVAYIDPLDTKDGDTMGFSISAKGREVLGQ